MKFTKKEKCIIASVVTDRCLEVLTLAVRLQDKKAKKHFVKGAMDYFKELRKLEIKTDKWTEEK